MPMMAHTFDPIPFSPRPAVPCSDQRFFAASRTATSALFSPSPTATSPVASRAPKVPTSGAKSAAAGPAGAPGQVPSQADEPQSITQALRALQGRAPANADQ